MLLFSCSFSYSRFCQLFLFYIFLFISSFGESFLSEHLTLHTARQSRASYPYSFRKRSLPRSLPRWGATIVSYILREVKLTFIILSTVFITFLPILFSKSSVLLFFFPIIYKGKTAVVHLIFVCNLSLFLIVEFLLIRLYPFLLMGRGGNLLFCCTRAYRFSVSLSKRKKKFSIWSCSGGVGFLTFNASREQFLQGMFFLLL